MNGVATVATSQLPKIVRNGQCIGCGFCQVSANRGMGPIVPMHFSEEEEFWIPDISSLAPSDKERRICPGAQMDMPAISQLVFGEQPNDVMVGHARLVAAGHATDPLLRQAAASGGVTTAILTHLFDNKAIDVAYCTAGLDPANGAGSLIDSPEKLVPTLGSHYHPVHFGAALPQLVETEGRFAFVGLPCEVAALRQLMVARPDLAARCVLVIGLFCGGINRYSGIGDYLRHFEVDPEAVTQINYRDGFWPGRIKVTSRDNANGKTIPRIMGNSRWNILRYVISFQGYSMLPRCRICPDQIADFADIAVGDPHIARFKAKDSPGHSAVVARTETGKRLLCQALDAGVVALEALSREELIRSQGCTLENRRHAPVYKRMAQRLAMVPPNIEVYNGLELPRSWHQHVYALVDLAKIRLRKVRWLRPFYLPFQIFEYLFLTFSIRLLLTRLEKLGRDR